MDYKFISVISKLQNQDCATSFIQHCKDVQQFYASDYAKRENLLSFARGKVWTEKDYAEFAKQNKKPISLLWMKDSQRAFLGAIVQNKFDATFQPFDVKNPKAAEMAEMLKYRYMRDAETLEFSEKDKKLIIDCWATGVGYQELYALLEPGERPEYHLSNENVLAIYWDPNSKELGRRGDAQFVDRSKYVSLEDLQLNFPDEDFTCLEQSMDESYTQVNKVADRGHENEDSRNGLFLVRERFYKVTEREYYKLEEDESKTPISENEAKGYQEANKVSEEKAFIGRSEKEYLYLAIACPAWNGEKFLFNGKLSLQPRSDRNSKKVLWPILECVAESVGNDPVGFAEAMVDPIRIANGILTQTYHVARHAASTAKIFKPEWFLNPSVAKDFERNSADPTKNFPVKAEAPLADIIGNIPNGSMSTDAKEMLNTVLNFLEKVSSTPPALKGQQESASVSGKLNEQRINQSFIQLQEFQSNYRNFIRRRAELLRAYDVLLNDSFIDEEVKVSQKQSLQDPDSITLNEVDEEMDEFGNPTGRLTKKNDAAEMDFKVVITDSYASPVKAESMKSMLVDLLNVPAIQQDAGMLLAIAYEIVQFSDMPLETKDRILQASTQAQQEQAKKQAMENQGQQLENEKTQTEIQQAQQVPPEAPPQMAA